MTKEELSVLKCSVKDIKIILDKVTKTGNPVDIAEIKANLSKVINNLDYLCKIGKKE